MTRLVDGIGGPRISGPPPEQDNRVEKTATEQLPAVQGYDPVSGDAFVMAEGDVWPAEQARQEALKSFVGRSTAGASATDAATTLCAELEAMLSTGSSKPGEKTLTPDLLSRIEALLSGPLATERGVREVGWEGRRRLIGAVHDANAALMAQPGWHELGGRLTFLVARCEQMQDARTGNRHLQKLGDDLFAAGNYDAAAFAYGRLAFSDKNLRAHHHLTATLAHLARGEAPPKELLGLLRRAGKSGMFSKSHLRSLCAELWHAEDGRVSISAETLASLRSHGEDFFIDGLRRLGATEGADGSLSLELAPRTLETMLATGKKMAAELTAEVGEVARLRAELESESRAWMQLSKEERASRMTESQQRCRVINGQLEAAEARTRQAAVAIQKSLVEASPITQAQADELAQWIRIDERAAGELPAAQIRAKLALMLRLTGGRGLMALGYVTKSSDRASASKNDGELNVGGGLRLDAAPIWHEFAHFIEYDSPSLYAAAVEWRASRAVGNAPRPLRELIPKGHYAANEVAWEDSFVSPYVGRHYEGEQYTEVISVGLEHFVSPGRLVNLASRDGEHLQLVLGALGS